MSQEAFPSVQDHTAALTGDHFLHLGASPRGDALELLVGEEVDVVGRVDCLRDAVDLVGDWKSREGSAIAHTAARSTHRATLDEDGNHPRRRPS